MLRLSDRARFTGAASVALAGCLAAILTRAPHLWDASLFDVDVYLTIGQQWWNGAVPYRDLFDQKGPFLYEWFALLSAALPNTIPAVRIAFAVAFLGSVVQMSALARRHLDGPGTWCATLAYAIAASSVAFEGPDPNADQWALIGLVASVDLADRRRCGGSLAWAAAAGGVLALLVAIKPHHAVMLPFVALLLALGAEGRVRALVLAGGTFAAVLIATVVPIALGGGLGEMRFIMTTYNPEFIRVAVDELTAGGARAGIDWLMTYPATAYALVGVALGLVAFSDRRLRPVAWLGLAWLLAAWIFALAGVRLYPHYFIATVPPLALLAGAGVSALARRSAAAGPVVAAVVVAAVCVPLAVDGWRSALEIPVAQRWMGRHVPALSPVADAARIVGGVTAPGDRIYVHTAPLYGGQTIYWLTGRRPADRLTFPGDMVPPRYDEVAARLAADPPAAIVTMPGAPQGGLDGAIAKGRMKVVARLADGVGRELLVWSSRPLPEWLTAHAQAP